MSNCGMDSASSGVFSTLTNSDDIRKFLQNTPSEDRKALVDTQVKEGTVLFKACCTDDTEFIKFLLEECDADTEIKGIHVVPEHDYSKHKVPPLWRAAITNKLDVVKLLIEHGAEVNGCSDSASTAVRAACYNNHKEMVKYLVENGADVNIPNKYGSTCLMNSIESTELCEYLLEKGADVNAVEKDREFLTALHYAVNYDQLDTVKLFLKQGADINAKTSAGLTPILLAALYNEIETFKFLLEEERNGISVPDKIDAMEILGAKLIADEDVMEGISWWRKALEKRSTENIPKMLPPPLEIYGNAKEPENLIDLENLSMIEENLYVHLMMVYHRILTPFCEHSIYRNLRYARILQSSQKYQEALNVYKHTHRACMEGKDFLGGNCIRCVSFMLTLLSSENIRDQEVRTSNVLQIFEDLILHVTAAGSHLLSSEIVEDVDHKNYCQLLRLMLDTVVLAMQWIHGKDKYVKENFFRCVKKFVKLDPKGWEGQSLTHMAVTTFNHSMPHYRRNINPSEQRVLLTTLLFCGADINAVDDLGNSPLFYHVNEIDEDEDEDHEILDELLNRGAHIDMCNDEGVTPMDVIREKDIAVCELRYRSLQCLVATVICRHNILYRSEISSHLANFVQMHGRR